MSDVARKRGRPRKASADREILDATLELLSERGYRDFNVDDIAERTGIAKTTIYRRWPTKGALVAAAIGSPPPGLSADALLADTDRVLTLLRGADTVDVLQAVLAPRHAALTALIGADDADVRIGRLVARWISDR